MSKLIDFLTFKDNAAIVRTPVSESLRIRRDERDIAVLSGKYPPDAADIETLSEYRLASLMQYPHY